MRVKLSKIVVLISSFVLSLIFYHNISNKSIICKISSRLSFVPVLIVHPNLTYYSMLSIWQARQLNEEVHILYDHNGTIKQSCSKDSFNYHQCSLLISTKINKLIESLRSSKIYFVDLNSKYLQNEVNDFLDAFERGNNKSLFDRSPRDKWIYEQWCAVRWLYAYNYAVFRKFDVMYIQDSDVLLYGNITMEFDYLQPIDVGMSGSAFRDGNSGHNTFFRLKALRKFVNFMVDTWNRRNDLGSYVRGNWVTDMFYFTHLFAYRNNHQMRRSKGLIVRLLHDVYYADKYNSSSGRTLDWHVGDPFDQRFTILKLTYPGGISDLLKNLTWITEKGEQFRNPTISLSMLSRFPIIYHNELQINIRMINLHFFGIKKRFMPFYIQRYISVKNIDQLLQFNILSNQTL